MNPWTSLPGLLLSLFSLLNKLEADKRKQKEDIQKAVSIAFHHTERYYAFLEDGSSRDRGKEFDLALDWETAGILIRSVSPDLADRIGLKSSFWRNGGIWDSEEIKEAGIQLDFIRAEGMTL